MGSNRQDFIKKGEINFLYKFIKNIERDRFVIQELIRTGWAYLIIWECEIKNKVHLMDKIHNFLGPIKNNQGPFITYNNVTCN